MATGPCPKGISEPAFFPKAIPELASYPRVVWAIPLCPGQEWAGPGRDWGSTEVVRSDAAPSRLFQGLEPVENAAAVDRQTRARGVLPALRHVISKTRITRSSNGQPSIS